MDFFAVINARHSVRKYKSQGIPEEELQLIFRMLNRAPSAGNLQAFEVFVIDGPDRLLELSRAALDQEFIAEAPVALVFCANPVRSRWKYGVRGERLYSIQDATIACAYAQLVATASGLGSVWVGAFDDERVLRILGSPTDLVPVAILSIGYSDEEPYRTGRRRIEDIIHRHR